MNIHIGNENTSIRFILMVKTFFVCKTFKGLLLLPLKYVDFGVFWYTDFNFTNKIIFYQDIGVWVKGREVQIKN